jgi:predicted transcriptional regulator of viral defense system
MIDVAVIALLSDVQDGLMTTGQLRQIGVDRSSQSRRAAQGVLPRVHRGVWCLVGAPTTWKQQVLAATLVGGSPRPAASHRSALRLNGLRSDSAVEVSIAYPAVRQIDGVVIHLSIDRVDADLVEIDRIRSTSVYFGCSDVGRFGADFSAA